MALATRYLVEGIVIQLQLTKDEVAELDEEQQLQEPQDELHLAPPLYIKQKTSKRCLDCLVRSNRHENLFPCGRFGIWFFMFEFQVILNLSLLVLIALFWNLSVDIKLRGHGAWYVLWVVDVLLYLATVFYFLPACIRKYMVITNVTLFLISRLN